MHLEQEESLTPFSVSKRPRKALGQLSSRPSPSERVCSCQVEKRISPKTVWKCMVRALKTPFLARWVWCQHQMMRQPGVLAARAHPETTERALGQVMLKRAFCIRAIHESFKAISAEVVCPVVGTPRTCVLQAHVARMRPPATSCSNSCQGAPDGRLKGDLLRSKVNCAYRADLTLLMVQVLANQTTWVEVTAQPPTSTTPSAQASAVKLARLRMGCVLETRHCWTNGWCVGLTHLKSAPM